MSGIKLGGDDELVRLRSGDWVDPLAVTVIIAGRSIHKGLPDGREPPGFVRIETKQGYLLSHFENLKSAEKYRDTLAALCNMRRKHRAELRGKSVQRNGERESLVSHVDGEHRRDLAEAEARANGAGHA